MTSNEHALNITALKVLEDWAMMLVDSEEEVTFPSDQDLLCSTISFKGVIDGEVSILAPKSFVTTLACNVLGVEESEASDDEKRDAFCEMNNVLTGNFLTEAYGADTVFDVILPQVREIQERDLNSLLQSRVVFRFLADSQPVAFTFKVNQ